MRDYNYVQTLAVALPLIALAGLMCWHWMRQTKPPCPACGCEGTTMIGGGPIGQPEVGKQTYRHDWTCPCGNVFPVEQNVTVNPTAN